MKTLRPERRSRLLDTTGLRCPVPVLMAARAMEELAVGERLDLLGDDPDLARDIPAWCEQSGNRLLRLERNGRLIRCELERAEVPAVGP